MHCTKHTAHGSYQMRSSIDDSTLFLTPYFLLSHRIIYAMHTYIEFKCGFYFCLISHAHARKNATICSIAPRVHAVRGTFGSAIARLALPPAGARRRGELFASPVRLRGRSLQPCNVPGIVGCAILRAVPYTPSIPEPNLLSNARSGTSLTRLLPFVSYIAPIRTCDVSVLANLVPSLYVACFLIVLSIASSRAVGQLDRAPTRFSFAVVCHLSLRLLISACEVESNPNQTKPKRYSLDRYLT